MKCMDNWYEAEHEQKHNCRCKEITALIKFGTNEAGYTDTYICAKCYQYITTKEISSSCDFKYCPYCGCKIVDVSKMLV